jgi:hypothetical protein
MGERMEAAQLLEQLDQSVDRCVRDHCVAFPARVWVLGVDFGCCGDRQLSGDRAAFRGINHPRNVNCTVCVRGFEWKSLKLEVLANMARFCMLSVAEARSRAEVM